MKTQRNQQVYVLNRCRLFCFLPRMQRREWYVSTLAVLCCILALFHTPSADGRATSAIALWERLSNAIHVDDDCETRVLRPRYACLAVAKRWERSRIGFTPEQTACAAAYQCVCHTGTRSYPMGLKIRQGIVVHVGIRAGGNCNNVSLKNKKSIKKLLC